MFNLTINNTNVTNSLNNMYQYQFKNGAFEVPANAEMMITSFNFYWWRWNWCCNRCKFCNIFRINSNTYCRWYRLHKCTSYKFINRVWYRCGWYGNNYRYCSKFNFK